MTSEPEAFITCQCGTEGLMFRVFDEDSEYPLYCISFWTEGFHHRSQPLRSRLRAIRHIIRHGEPYDDMILLDKPGLIRLRNIISDLLEPSDG